MHQYDKSSKWLIQHHGDSILRLAGVLDIVSWQPLPAELVQSRRLPDGLIEVRRHGQAEPGLIDQDAPPDEHENLLAVTQFLARLRYHDPKLFQLLGGRKAMIESPLLDELKAEWARETTRKDILKFLEARFGIAPRALEAELKTVDEARLDDLLSLAATCRTLGSFRKKVSP
jgi:hypothetical protein